MASTGNTMSNTVNSVRADGHAMIQIGNNYYSDTQNPVYQRNDRCLADLCLTDPCDDKARIKESKGGLLKDSYKWILDHPDFQRWRDDECSRLLWIKGDAGRGKTMLLIGIIEELLQQLKQLSSTTPDAGLLSFFFCQGTDSHLNNATAVLRGLIYLLLVQQPSLISHLRRKYDHAGRGLFEDANAFYALSEIFRDMLHDPGLRGAYMIIDALDECETGLPQLLDFIVHNASTSRHIKWIVSSRNRHDIEWRLRLDDTRMRLSLELNARHVSSAVDIYIDYKVLQLASLKHNRTLQGQVRDRIRLKANGTFLWVALVFKELQDVQSWDVLQVVEEVPTDLVPLYDRMIRQIQQLKRRDHELCRLVLSTATLTHRPLHLLELGVLSGLPEQILGNTQSVVRIADMCGSFLTIQDEFVYLIHQSAKDYLSTSASTAIFPAGPAEVNYRVFSRSLQVMSKTLQRDIYNLRHPGILIDQVKPASPDPLTPLRYSCVYWTDHLCEVDSSSSQYQSNLRDSGTVYLFLQKNFLYWLEALSLMGSMSDGVLAIAKLESSVRVSLHFNNITLLENDTNELGSSRLNLSFST
jgi:NACHT domain